MVEICRRQISIDYIRFAVIVSIAFDMKKVKSARLYFMPA